MDCASPAGPRLVRAKELAKASLSKRSHPLHLFCVWYCSFPALPVECLCFDEVLFPDSCSPPPRVSPSPCSGRVLGSTHQQPLGTEPISSQEWGKCGRLTISIVPFKLWCSFPVGIGCAAQRGQNYYFSKLEMHCWCGRDLSGLPPPWYSGPMLENGRSANFFLFVFQRLSHKNYFSQMQTIVFLNLSCANDESVLIFPPLLF